MDGFVTYKNENGYSWPLLILKKLL